MDLTNFMERLTKQSGSPTNRVFSRQTRKIDRVQVNNPETLGRYQVLPLNYAVTDFPFIKARVNQVRVPRRRVDESGEIQEYSTWIHIPSPDFYQMVDATGRVVSSLTADDEKLLSSVNSLWNEVYNEFDGKTNFGTVSTFVRYKNLTIFTGYCLNFWKYGSNNRTPDRQNFSALFVVTTNNFIQNLETSINDKSAMEGGPEWIEKVYNSQLKNRDGFLMFSINKDRNTPGFIASVQHEFGRSQMLSGIEIPQEDFDTGMDDAAYLFLGWQANSTEREKPSGTRRLFNTTLMKETAAYLTKLLAAARAEKAAAAGNPIDIPAVVEKVVADYYANMPMPEPKQPAQAQTAAPTPSMESPTSHIDPVMGNTPIQENGSSSFGGNGFGGFSPSGFNTGFGGGNNNGTPF